MEVGSYGAVPYGEAVEPVVPVEPASAVSFDDWLGAVSTSRVVLAELQPAEPLSGWTQAAAAGDEGGLLGASSYGDGPLGGAIDESAWPNVYSVAWPTIIASSAVPGGIARRLDEVRENGIRYTLQASVAAVNSNAGSYYLASDTLYISTTTGSAPSTFASIAAFFSLFVATAPMDFVGGALYEPRLTGALPAVTANAEDDFNATKTFAQGAIDLVNTVGLFDTLSRSYVWRNKAVNLFLGGGTVPRASYEQVAALRVDSVTVTDEVARLAVRSTASLLEQQVPFSTITRTDYPDAADGVEGTYKPLLYGRKRGIPAPLVDSYLRRNPDVEGLPSDYADVYLVADASVQELTAVLGVWAVSVDTGAVVALAPEDYAVDLLDCTVTVTTAAFRSDQWAIRVDATGETDGGSGYLDTVGEISEHLLLALGAATADIDSASFAAADTAAPFPLGLWIREPVQASQIVILLQQSVLGALFIGREGRWKWRVLDLADTSTAGTLEDADFVAWQPVERIDPIYPLVRLYFDMTPTTEGDLLEGYKLVTAEKAETRYLYETAAGVSIRTALTERSDAQLLAQRYRLLAGAPDTQVNADLRGLSMMTADLYDRVLVTRGRAPDTSGAFVSHRMEIVGIEKRLDPVGVRVRLSDVGGLSSLYGGVREWANDDAPDTWALSSETEQDELMYWGDDDDEVDTGVTNPSIWW